MQMRYTRRYVLIALLAGCGACAHGQTQIESGGNFTVSGSAGECSVGGRHYSTGFDCAVARAVTYAETHHQPVDVRVGPGVFETCTGLQMLPSTPYTVNLHGAGKGEFGGGTVLKLVGPLTTAVIQYPYLQRSQHAGYWSNLNLQGFTVDANGQAPMCFDLYALRVAHLTDLSCTGATGKRSWMRIGGFPARLSGTVPEGFNGGAFQVMASDIFLYHNGYSPQAIVEAELADGAIRSYRVIDAGRFRETGTVRVYLKGADASVRPCRVMPHGVTGHVAKDLAHPGFTKLDSITQDSHGEGCAGQIRVAVVDTAAADYGFEIEATDSSFYDLTDDSVGGIAGIEDRVSGKALFVHPHVWNTWGGMELWGGETVISPEFDSLYGYGVHFRYGSGSVVLNPTFVYLRHPAYDAATDFLFGPEAKNMSVSNQQCETPNTNAGYVQFVGKGGALDLGNAVATSTTDGRSELFPQGFRAIDLSTCSKLRALQGGAFVSSSPIRDTAQERRMAWSGGVRSTGVATSFLFAELPAATSALRVTLASFHDGEASEEQSLMLFSGTSRAGTCNASKVVASGASIQLYKQPDGSSRIYVHVDPGTSTTALLDLVQGSDIHLEPSPPQEEPSGMLLFDSSACVQGATAAK